jgi:hypothetical protein
MIWDHADDDPYKNDIIRMELSGEIPVDGTSGLDTDDAEGGDVIVDVEHEEQMDAQREQEEISANRRLDEVLDFYDCGDVLEFVDRIFKISAEKEATGMMPKTFMGSHNEIRGLVILGDEIKKKEVHASQQMRRDSDRQQQEARATTTRARGRSTIPHRRR